MEAKSSAQALEMLVGLSLELLWVLQARSHHSGLGKIRSSGAAVTQHTCSGLGMITIDNPFADNQFPRDLLPDLPEEDPILMVFSWSVLWYWSSAWPVTFSLGHLGG